MKFTLVLHGGFEDIAIGETRPTGISLREKNISGTPLFKKIRQAEFGVVFGKVWKFSKKLLGKPLDSISSGLFRQKEMLFWMHSSDFRYIALSRHVKVNAGKYIDVEALNLYTVILPTFFEETISQPKNEYVKFAIFGYGDSLMLYNIALLLSERKLKNKYEIRIIGMDNRGAAGFSNITCPSPGKVLERSEMKKYAGDIDLFLLLYGKDRYSLSCSGSILESLSYSKPILHFNNDCINTFNTQQNPIGFCCNNLDEFVDKMEDIINNYSAYISEFQKFRGNILKLRKDFSIESSVREIKNSFTW